MISKSELKFIKSLKIKKYRTAEKCFLVEGEKNILELIHSNYTIKRLLATKNFLDKHQDQVNSLPYEEISVRELSQVSSFVTNDQALAVVEIHTFSLENINLTKNIFVLDGIRDPGNLGTIIRTLDWFGFRQLVCSPDTVELFNPKVISATMGSFVRVKVVYHDLEKFLKNYDGDIIGAVMNGELLEKTKFTNPNLIVLGSESHGISPSIQSLLDHSITIPKYGEAESLNVGVAAGILCHALASE